MTRIEQKKRYMVESVFDKYKPFSKDIANMHVLIYGDSGHGKTLAEEVFVEKMHDKGYNVIVLTEKFKHRLEFGFASFLPSAKYHLKYLEEQGKTPKIKKIRIYALWSYNKNKFWTKKIPDFKFFTIDVKNDVNTKLWSIIFNQPEKSWSIQAIVSAQNDLKNDEGLKDLIRIATNRIKNKQVQGTQGTIDEIKSILEPIVELGFLRESICKYNLNAQEIIMDAEHYKIFHYGLMPSKFRKEEYFVVNVIQEKLIKVYDEMKKDKRFSSKMPSMLAVIQEVNAFLPDRTDNYYINKSAELTEENLLQIRSLGWSSIGDAQKVYATSERYRDSVTDSYYGRLATNDVERLGKVRRYNVAVRNRLESMPKNHYKKKGDYHERVFLFPCHAHCEEGEDYYIKFAKEHPDRLKKHTDVYEEIKKLQTLEMDRHKQFLKEQLNKSKKKDVKKELKKIEKLEKTEVEKGVLKKKLKQSEEELQNKLYVELYELSKLNPECIKSLSWVKLGDKYGISDHTAKSWANKGRTIVQ